VRDDDAAKQQVIELPATVTGRLSIDAGALRPARQLEPLTAVLISSTSATRCGPASTSLAWTAEEPVTLSRCPSPQTLELSV
jgi:predicted dinucleotide-binding enzyme